MTHIPIFFTFDNNYVEPAAVAFYSLLNNAKKDIFYEMYVLHSNISAPKQQLLTNIVHTQGNARLTFINTNTFLSTLWSNGTFNFQAFKSNFTADTLARCFAAKFFPQYSKIIYSDVDIVVTGDISAVYDVDLSHAYIAGVKNPFLKFSAHELSHLKPPHYTMLCDKYIAGGIWVMNLDKIRQDNLEERMLEIIEDKTIVKRWNDQDIINIACQGQVTFLPLNYISYPYMIDLLNNPQFTSHYTRQELFDSILHPKIIHYAAQKPWNGVPRKADIWWEIFYYLKLSPTVIFREVRDDEKHKLSQKYHKYRYISVVLGICFTILFIAFFALIVLK